jgi:hypothetical protein
MGTATNITFTLLIKINGRLREFNFRKRADLNYDTDTNDERGNRYMFRMIKENETWKIKGQELPKWLLESDAFIHEALVNNQ